MGVELVIASEEVRSVCVCACARARACVCVCYFRREADK
jgi:hypothetical protein